MEAVQAREQGESMKDVIVGVAIICWGAGFVFGVSYLIADAMLRARGGAL